MNISMLVLKGLPFPGGVERYTEAVGPRLAAKGHRVGVYSMGSRTEVERKFAGMDVKTVPAIHSKSLEKPSAALIAAARAAFDGADLVHVHTFGQTLFGVLPRLAGKKVVLQGHGIEWRRSKWGWPARVFLRASERASLVVPNAVTVVSRTQQAYMKDQYGLDATYIPPGITPAERVQPSEIRRLGLEGNDYILFAARLEREKGASYLIDAYRRLKPRLKLVIAGDNLLDRAFRDEVHARAEGDPNILFTGFAVGRLLAELFSNCALFVLPSELEGLPVAVLEAMSYGCGCLVSDIPENREAIDGHGFTFRDRDPEDLARQLETLLSRPQLVTEAGRAARAHVIRNYSWDTVADDLEALYQRVLTRAPSRSRWALHGARRVQSGHV